MDPTAHRRPLPVSNGLEPAGGKTDTPAAHRSVELFFTENDGRSLLGAENVFPDLPNSPVASVLQNLSTSTVNSLTGQGIVGVPLSALCEMVQDSASLSAAEIIMSECHSQQISRVTHRFLVFELRRRGRANIWLRLDRRAGRSALRLFRSLGSSPAHDTALLAPQKSDLVGLSHAENRQIFHESPTLGELQLFLRAVVEELKNYQIWGANCWFFCSLVQQHLERNYQGSFLEGDLPYQRLAQDVRCRVSERYRLLNHMPPQFSRTELLQSLQRTYPKLGICPIINLSRKLERWPAGQHSSRYFRLASQFCRSLHDIARQLYEQKQLIEAGFILEQRVFLLRRLCAVHPGTYRAELASALSHYGIYLYDIDQADNACSVHVDAVGLMRELYTNRPEAHQVDFADIAYNCGVCLHLAQRHDEALEMAAEVVSLRRRLYKRKPELNGADLAAALHAYASCLQSIGHYDQARFTYTELVALRRQIFEAEKQKNEETTLVFRRLDETGHGYLPYHREQSHVSRIGAAISRRRIYQSDPTIPHNDLALSLLNLGAILLKSGHLSEACEASSEAACLLRFLYAESPRRHRANLLSALHNHALSLHALGRVGESGSVKGDRDRFAALPD